VTGVRKISRFINEEVVEKLNKELEKDKENFQQRLIRGYQYFEEPRLKTLKTISIIIDASGELNNKFFLILFTNSVTLS
jgi:predicted metal-dependent peptidase